MDVRKPKIYIVCVVWRNTAHNHAGMLHLARKMKKYFGNDARLITIPVVRGFHRLKIVYHIFNFIITHYLLMRIKKQDILFLMEYFLNTFEQSYIARKLQGKSVIIAIAHLVPYRITEQYTDMDILEKTSYVNYLLVLGSSLKQFFVQKGIPQEKVINTFHYVDNDFYRIKYERKKENKPLIVICMGNMERDYMQLSEIIKETPSITYHICAGVNTTLGVLFSSYANVSLHGYIDESELKDVMHRSDISLNVMNDTVGSNVITTSLASGLAMVCSDVGSIQDYVPPENGILFKNTKKAVEALQYLDKNRDRLYQFQILSLQKAKEIDVNVFLTWFSNFIKTVK